MRLSNGIFQFCRDRGDQLGALALLIMFAVLPGCGATCQAERDVVSALDAGVSAAEEQLRDSDADGWEDMARYSRGAVLLGDAVVSSCDFLRDDSGWEQWIMMALESATGLAAIFGGAGPEDAPPMPPPELSEAIRLLEAEELEGHSGPAL